MDGKRCLGANRRFALTVQVGPDHETEKYKFKISSGGRKIEKRQLNKKHLKQKTKFIKEAVIRKKCSTDGSDGGEDDDAEDTCTVVDNENDAIVNE